MCESISFPVFKILSFMSPFVVVDTGEELLIHHRQVLSNLFEETEDFEQQTGLVEYVFSKLW